MLRPLVASSALVGIAALVAGCPDFGSLSGDDGTSSSADGGGGTSDAGAGDANRLDGGGGSDATSTSDGALPDANGEGGTEAGVVDAGPPWKLYSQLEMSSPNTWNVIGLDVAWSGPNAPPPRGIMATCQLNSFDRLLVWADNGKFYVRDPGGWRTPQDTATVFPALTGRDFRGCGHQPESATAESIVLVDNPTAILYDYSSQDVASFVSTVTMTDETGPYGAPKATKKVRWVIRHWDPSKQGTAAYLAEYSGYDNDAYVYFYDATPAPTNKWLFADAPLFAGKTNVPPQAGIMAGWRNDAYATNYLIVK